MAQEEGMIYHCWASVSPMHASSSPPIVAYSAKDGAAKRAGSRQRGRCGGSTGRCATDFKHLGCTGLIGLAQRYNAHPLIQVRGKQSKPRAKQRRRQQRRQKKERKEEQRRNSPLRKKREEKRQKEHQHQPERKQEEKRRSRNCHKNSLQVFQELHDTTL